MSTTREPLAIRAGLVGLLVAAINWAVVMGWINMTDTQEAATASLIGLAGTAVVIIATRGKVTPVAAPQTDAGVPLVPAYAAKHEA